MTYHFILHTKRDVATPSRLLMTLLVFWRLIAMAPAESLEKIPGLTVKAGVQVLGTSPAADPKDFKDIVDAAPAPNGTLQFWTWLQGDAAALEYLKKPGILPLAHEVCVPWPLGVHFLQVQIVGEEKMNRPDWWSNYINLLTNEFKSHGSFTTSELSRYSPTDYAQRYIIRFRTKQGKLLADANGKTFSIKIAAPH